MAFVKKTVLGQYVISVIFVLGFLRNVLQFRTLKTMTVWMVRSRVMTNLLLKTIFGFFLKVVDKPTVENWYCPTTGRVEHYKIIDD